MRGRRFFRSCGFSFSRLREKVPEADEGNLAMSNQLALTLTLSRGAGEGEKRRQRTGAIRCWYGVPAHITYGSFVSGSALFGYES